MKTKTTYPDVYEGSSKSRDYAIDMAAHVLGGQRSSINERNEVLFKAGLYKFAWVNSGGIISSKGLPTITLPSKFKFTKVTTTK